MKKRAAILFGGQSSEHSISCVSAASVFESIDRDKYEVVAVGIAPSGRWFSVSDDGADWHSKDGKLPEVPEDGNEIRIVGRSRAEGFEGYDPSRSLEEELASGQVVVDVAFPVLHGMFGEDGTIQGGLEVMGIPYVGSGVLASAAGMDKEATKILLASQGLPVGTYEVVSHDEWDSDQAGVLAKVEALGFPSFVKPARAGSSVGISKLKEPSGLATALDLAFEHDKKAIIELSVENAREVECAVLQDADGVGATPSRCAEIIVGGEHEFYDFDAKYIDNDVELVVPADISPELHQELGEAAVKAFKALGARGLSRVDFFVTPDNNFVINEVNTMPGFTRVSLYPRMVADSGVSFTELVDRLLSLALVPTLGPR